LITFVLLGNNITRIPTIGKMLIVGKSLPNAESLCFTRINAAKQVNTEYFSILDGGEDILYDNFESSTKYVCEELSITGLNIGTSKDIKRGVPGGRYMQHCVVCRTSAFNLLDLPTSGLFHFEPMVYGQLCKNGIVYHNEIIYEWVPSPSGAATWRDTSLARINGARWAAGKYPVDLTRAISDIDTYRPGYSPRQDK